MKQPTGKPEPIDDIVDCLVQLSNRCMELDRPDVAKFLAAVAVITKTNRPELIIPCTAIIDTIEQMDMLAYTQGMQSAYLGLIGKYPPDESKKK